MANEVKTIKVIATAKGYYGGMIREPGAMFRVPEDRKLPSWVRHHAFGGKGDHDGDGKPGGSKPKPEPKPAAKPAADPDAVVVPAGWQKLKAADRKALATAITGEKAPNAADADRVILAYLESQKPEPFEDAPAPETAKGNGLQDALGGVQPDWVAPNDQ